MSIFQVPAILTRIAALKDGGLSLGFSTNELTTEEKTTVFSFYQQFGYCLFKESQFSNEEIPKTEATDLWNKTSSQRLRDVMFVWWTQLGKPDNDFQVFYKRQMELIINSVKNKLEDK